VISLAEFFFKYKTKMTRDLLIFPCSTCGRTTFDANLRSQISTSLCGRVLKHLKVNYHPSDLCLCYFLGEGGVRSIINDVLGSLFWTAKEVASPQVKSGLKHVHDPKIHSRAGLFGSRGGDTYGEASPRGLTPYPFIYHFGRKGTPFIHLLLKKGTPLLILELKFSLILCLNNLAQEVKNEPELLKL